ncbi:replicative DNA helicase [Pararhodobacter marinus]|uniref:DNA 5'-3' helicase n=1 Tax=Pararhodobacter marinus TaxID=2184063 RepID=A0A2U2C4B8_9RHOB|nr:DnaB-like helicase C-terminal domain-containing protein [Pararhodobacter marinus]PWE26707.1 replicative DNA helicase [Pararhodobacter marinus]
MTQIVQFRQEEQIPHSVPAEQQILGAMLCRQDLIPSIMARGGADLFADPVHAAIFEAARAKDARGELASPVTLAPQLAEHLSELGGSRYLARLAGAAAGRTAAKAYIDQLADLRDKRRIVAALSEARAAMVESSAATVAAQLEAALAVIQPAVGENGPVSMMSATMKAMEQISAAYAGEDDGSVKSGIGALDTLISGFYPGELTLIGGRPSMGKTAVALQAALHVARAGHGVCIASLEMNPEAMAVRALSEATANAGNGVNYSSMRRGEMAEHQVDTLRKVATPVADLPIMFLSRQHSDLGALYAGAKQAKRMMGDNLRLLVVDYAQLLRSKASTRYEQITEISIALKALAGQLNVPVIALSQLSRSLESREDKRPQLSDLRESGQLEQDADCIIFCYRDEYYLERERPDADDIEDFTLWQQAMDKQRNRLELIVAKQRQGSIGTARLKFNPALNTIWEDEW